MPIKCVFEPCHYKHLDLLELKVHIHSRHDLNCPHCDFSDQENMEKHLKTTHENSKTYHCNKCDLFFTGPFGFWKHRRDFHSPILMNIAKGPQTCVFCQKKFVNLEELFQHVYVKHDPCCPFCNYVNRGEDMKEHLVRFSHVWNDTFSLKCSVWGCIKRFDSHQDYWAHRLNHHPEAMKNVKLLEYQTIED